MVKIFKSFGYAISGIIHALKNERNMRIHFFAATCVFILSFVFRISETSFFAVVFSIGMVISAELFNTSIENLCDKITNQKNDKIKAVKDCAAGAVLVTAICATIVGFRVFGKPIFELVKQI